MKNLYVGYVDSKRVRTKKVWKVFSSKNPNHYTYCYSESSAKDQRRIYQELGYTRVMIKGRR